MADGRRQADGVTAGWVATPSVSAGTAGETVDHIRDHSTHPDNDSKNTPHCPAVPGYEVLRTLGRGGMGVVYLARHAGLNRLVALKMLLAGAHGDEGALLRFRTEAEAVAKLKHPNIIQIYDIGEAGGCAYLSLEYVEGGSLARLFDGTPQPPKLAAELVCTLARATHAAHESGVIHRDLKPANILLTADAVPKIADFGLAKQVEGSSGVTVSGSILGTPSYMAPEQADGQIHDLDARADVYSLGAILYEALTGRPPFRGASLLETLDQVRSQEPVAPSSLQPKTPRDLETICLKCLQKERARRYESAAALADDLRRFLNNEPIHARPVTTWERLARWRRRNPAVAGLIVTSVTLLVVGLVMTTSLALLANKRAQRIASMNKELIATAQEADARGELALKTLDTVIQDIQSELVNLPNAQTLRRRLLNRAMDGIGRLDDKLRDQQRVGRTTALALLNLAEVFRQVGGGAGAKGPAMANSLYERAIAAFESLHAASPHDAAAKRQLAEACLLFGANLAHTDDTGWEVTAASTEELKKRPLMQRGLAVHRRAADLRRDLLAATPDDPNAQYELARALSEWAYQEVRAGDVETTRQILEEAIELLKRRLSADPRHLAARTMYAKTLERLGDWHYDMKQDYVRCEPYYRESLSVFERLAEESPNDPAVQMAYANSWSRLADFHRARNDLAAALAASQRELAITQKLEKPYADNFQIINDASQSYDHNFRDNFALGNYEAARDMIRRAFDLRLPQVDADPDNRRNMSQLGRSTRRLGGIYVRLGQMSEAIAAYETGLSRLNDYRKRSNDTSVDKDITAITADLTKCKQQLSSK